MAQKKKEAEAQYAPSTQQLDLEARRESGNASDRVISTAPNADQGERPEDVEGYVNVDPIYQNYANDTEKPLAATEGVEAEYEEEGFGVVPQHSWDVAESTSDVEEPSKPALKTK